MIRLSWMFRGERVVKRAFVEAEKAHKALNDLRAWGYVAWLERV